MSRKSRERGSAEARGGRAAPEGVVIPRRSGEKNSRHALLRERGGKGGRASPRARARTEIVPSHGAQIEAEAVEREVGRVRVHHLELRRERNGGEGVRRGIFTKTTDGKARVAKFRPSPRSADRVFRGATGELLPAETKTFPFDGSVGSFRFREIRKVAKCKLSREITQRLNPGVSRSSLNRSRWFTALGM